MNLLRRCRAYLRRRRMNKRRQDYGSVTAYQILARSKVIRCRP